MTRFFQTLTPPIQTPLIAETSSKVYLLSELQPLHLVINLPKPQRRILPRQMKLQSRAYTNPLPIRKKKKSASIGIIKTLAEDCYEPSSPITGKLPSHTFAANIIQKNNKTSFTIFSKASSTLSGTPNSLNNLKTTPMAKNGVPTKASQSSANLVLVNSNLS